MNLRVCRVFKLLRHERACGFLGQFLGPLNGSRHAFGGGCQFQLGPQEDQHLAALYGHAFRHGEDQAVSLGGANESKGDSCVARCGLDEDGVGAGFKTSGLNPAPMP